VGEKLFEAKANCKHGEFQDWVKRNFEITPRTAQRWMLAAENDTRVAFQFSSLREATKPEPKQFEFPEPTPEEREAYAYKRETELRAREHGIVEIKELGAIRAFAEQIIKAGYRALSLKMHPDHGGTLEEMNRLKNARTLLEKSIK
jgi:hypothetical protein